jgi:Mannosyl-glycoprotein endo-beta-N-acetylglucosaminidase
MANIEQFSSQYGPLAGKVGSELGVSPDLLLGQWGLETGWGKGIIPGTNNLGNIMDFSGGGVAAVDNYLGRTDKYRAFETPEAFGAHFVDLIKRRYPNAVGAGDDAVKFATALKEGGYAEHPEYINSLVNTIQSVRKQPNSANLVASATTSDANPVGLSSMSNEQLLKLATPSAAKGLEGLSNEELLGMAKGQQPSAQAPQGPMGGADVAFQAITNIPSSAAKFAGDIYQAVTNPVETVKNIGMLGAGAIKNALPKSVTDFITSISSEPGQIDKAVEMANAAGGELARKYGSMEGFKTAIATDPVGTAADISMLFTGGGSLVGKLPGMVGRAGQTVANVGRAIDPLNIATKAVTKPLQLAEMLGTPAVGLATGAGAESIREAARAGAAGGTKAEAFLGQLRGNAPIENVVNTAKEAVAELYRNKSDAYKSGMTGVTQNRTLLDFAPIDQAIINAEKVGSFNGVVIRGNAASALKEIKDKVAEFKAGNPAVFRTVEGFDKLKQAIGDIQQALPYGTPARKVADDLYNSVKNEITKQAPDYAKVMGDYEQASALLKDIEGSLSLGKKANIDTSVRKLQSILRNNANTNYGRRVDLGRQLEATGVPGADTLFPQLAGQMLSSPTPRGIQGATSVLGGATAYATNPALLPGLVLTSPRLVGEAAYYGGKAGGAAQRVAEALKSYTGKSPIDPYTLRMLAAKLGQMQPEEQR